VRTTVARRKRLLLYIAILGPGMITANAGNDAGGIATFASEAVILALVGGVIGVAVGFGLAFLGRWMLGFPTEVPPWAVALSLGMSSGVGLIFGIYPAARAARLDPVEAMRSE
jgi:putative ABC transport system permease protein